MVMADIPPCLPPDPFLRIQLGRIGRERDKRKTLYLSEVGTDEASLMPGRAIPKDCDSFSRIRAPKVSKITDGRCLILPLAPHSMLFAITKIEGPIKVDFILPCIGFDLDCLTLWLPDRGKRGLKE